jgi:pilus assembly protein CpaB
MNKRLGVVLLFAAVISAGASFMLYRLLAGQAGASKPAPGVSVIVAAKPLRLGATIREADIKTVQWQGPVPPQATLKKEDAIGRGVVSDILEGEPIAEARLAAKGAGGGLAATIPPGMRAVAIRVNDVVSVAGFVLPGTRVDVLMSANAPNMDANAGRMTRTILQNIEVLSAGKELDRDSEGKPVNVPVINLLVTPEQAEVLSLASNEAKIQLVLRNPMDTDVAKTAGTQMAQLISPDAQKPAPVISAGPPRVAAAPARLVKEPEEPKPFTVEVIHGVKKKDSSFPGAGGVKP